MSGKPDTVKDYYERINNVLVYINNHINEDLKLDQIASISNFSVFHFHRIMKAYLNEPLWAYIMRIRLDTAARLLRYSNKPINEIAYEIGYETPSSLNKAFKKRFNVTPMEFRESKGFFHADGTFIQPPQKLEIMKLKPKIKEIKDKNVVYITTKGYNENIGLVWGKLVNFIKEHKLFSFNMEFFGISHDSPQVTEKDNCRYDGCITVRKPVKPIGEIGYKTIEGGKFAIFKYKGSYEKFDDVYMEIYSIWLPKSGYELRNQPPFDKYLTNPEKVKPENNITEIYIPIK